MKKIKGVFDSREEMLSEKDSLVEKYLAKGGVISYIKPSNAEIPFDNEPVKMDENDVNFE